MEEGGQLLLGCLSLLLSPAETERKDAEAKLDILATQEGIPNWIDQQL